MIPNHEAHTPADIPSLRSGPCSAQEPEELVILFRVAHVQDGSDEIDPEFATGDELAQHSRGPSPEPIRLLRWVFPLPARQESTLSLARSYARRPKDCVSTLEDFANPPPTVTQIDQQGQSRPLVKAKPRPRSGDRRLDFE